MAPRLPSAIHNHITSTGCSKTPRGLLFPLEDRWTVRPPYVGSPGCRRGQWGSRCSIHARRNLPDKAFGYLKRVRVTPGVNRPLTRLNPSFRYRHWPGFSDCTHPFGLAVAYVFIKQSKPPCHCNLRSPFLMKTAGIPYTKATGLICRIPSPYGIPVHLRFLSLAHLCRFWVRTLDPY